jgi:hypothetical protein
LCRAAECSALDAGNVGDHMLQNPRWQETKIDPTTSLILRTAAEIQDEKGWCTGTAQNDKGQVCPYGAMLLAIKKLAFDESRLRDAEYRLREYLGVSMDYVVWNDYVCKNKAQAVAALLGASFGTFR